MLKKLTKVLVFLIVLFLIYPYGYYVLKTDPYAGGGEGYYGVGAYIINLERSRARYRYIYPKVKVLGMPVARIAAIDGNALSQEELSKKVDFVKYKEFLGHLPKLGTIGYSLSHIKAWQTFLRSNFAYAVIFEDDVSFDPVKLRTIIRELINNATLWDIASFNIFHSGWPLVIKQLTVKEEMVVYLAEVTYAGGYLLNRSAAMKLLAKALPIKMPIDHYFTRSWELDLRFVGIEPRPIVQDFGDSDIGKSLSPGKYHMSTYAYFKRGVYKLHSYIIRFLYNFKVYIISKL